MNDTNDRPSANCLVCHQPLVEVHLHQDCVKDPGFNPDARRRALELAAKRLAVTATHVAELASDARSDNPVFATAAQEQLPGVLDDLANAIGRTLRASVTEPPRPRAPRAPAAPPRVVGPTTDPDRFTVEYPRPDDSEPIRVTYARTPEPPAKEVSEFWQNARAAWSTWLDNGGRAFLETWTPLPVEPDLSDSLWVAVDDRGAMKGYGATPEAAIRHANRWHLETYADVVRAADVDGERGIPAPGDERSLLFDGDKVRVLRLFGPPGLVELALSGPVETAY